MKTIVVALLSLLLGVHAAMAQTGGAFEFMLSLHAKDLQSHCESQKDAKECQLVPTVDNALKGVRKKNDLCTQGQAEACSTVAAWDRYAMGLLACDTSQAQCRNKAQRGAAAIFLELGATNEEAAAASDPPGSLVELEFDRVIKDAKPRCEAGTQDDCDLVGKFEKAEADLKTMQQRCVLGNDNAVCDKLESWHDRIRDVYVHCSSADRTQAMACLVKAPFVAEILDTLGSQPAMPTGRPTTAPSAATDKQAPPSARAACTATQIEQLRGAGLAKEQIEQACPGATASRCSADQMQVMKDAGLTNSQVEAACGAPATRAPNARSAAPPTPQSSPPAAAAAEASAFSGIWTVERQPTSRRSEPPMPIADQYDPSVMLGAPPQTWRIEVIDGQLSVTRLAIGTDKQEVQLQVSGAEFDADELRFTVDEAKYGEGGLAYFLTEGNYHLKSEGGGIVRGEYTEVQQLPSQIGGEGSRLIYEGTVRMVKSQAPEKQNTEVPKLTPDQTSLSRAPQRPALCAAARERNRECMKSAETMDTAVKLPMLATCEAMLAHCGQ
jgi:hypothetical protein